MTINMQIEDLQHSQHDRDMQEKLYAILEVGDGIYNPLTLEIEEASDALYEKLAPYADYICSLGNAPEAIDVEVVQRHIAPSMRVRILNSHAADIYRQFLRAPAGTPVFDDVIAAPQDVLTDFDVLVYMYIGKPGRLRSPLTGRDVQVNSREVRTLVDDVLAGRLVIRGLNAPLEDQGSCEPRVYSAPPVPRGSPKRRSTRLTTPRRATPRPSRESPKKMTPRPATPRRTTPHRRGRRRTPVEPSAPRKPKTCCSFTKYVLTDSEGREYTYGRYNSTLAEIRKVQAALDTIAAHEKQWLTLTPLSRKMAERAANVKATHDRRMAGFLIPVSLETDIMFDPSVASL